MRPSGEREGWRKQREGGGGRGRERERGSSLGSHSFIFQIEEKKVQSRTAAPKRNFWTEKFCFFPSFFKKNFVFLLFIFSLIASPLGVKPPLVRGEKTLFLPESAEEQTSCWFVS